MPKKGTTTKYKRRAGVNIGTLKKEGFAYDPPIPADQFGGDVKALRQFKVNYKPDGTGREKQWKGIHKNLESGKLYLADGERYRELTDTEYDYITKEIGEAKQLGDTEKRIGKPFRERAKDEEVIEPVETKVDAPKKRGRKKGTQVKSSVSDIAVKKALKLLEMMNNMDDTVEIDVSEEIIDGVYAYIDDLRRVYDPVSETLVGIYLGKGMSVKEGREELWEEMREKSEENMMSGKIIEEFGEEEGKQKLGISPSDRKVREIEEVKLALKQEAGEKFPIEPNLPAEDSQDFPEDAETEEEDGFERRPMEEIDVADDDGIITWTYEPEAIALKYIPQYVDTGGPDESEPIYTDYENNGKPILGNEDAGEWFPTAADEDWVDRQEGSEEEKALYYTDRDEDIIYREDEETGEEDEIVGIRGMRGHRRVLIFAPSQVGLDYPLLYDWEDKESLGNAYEYEVPEEDLGMLITSRYNQDFDYFEDSKSQAIENVRIRNKSIEELEKDLEYMNTEPYRSFHLSVLKEKKEMREQVINEIAEEILGGEIEESLKTKILEDLRSSKSKKETTDMGGGKGTVEQPKKMKMKKKKLTEAQLAALAAARERRRAKIAADKAAK